ncbi:hypothetical protein ASPZODRAFT_66308 [Penicilliopsis zonata CBS 506.65]|uniref:Uncharacterized protein n=1 Tax=Penicilliopsis zonata CBS 506.65 TaxID=1073090 RepID=A0A1L9SHW5_9EURO|nr:hypothetical protein ASPZODRAFT_66308 [Penicilliopsis zonata CBS 506.65]OJJ46696.1 hypothetical protein ASPZODRAFT_66308 [Penicilliopsis zonata CBS 506.65]
MNFWVGLLPTVAAFTAFTLSILCLFAGTQKNFIIDADILTINTPNPSSNIGISDFYSVYVMSYCEGVLEECSSPGSNVTRTGRNTTSCSDRKLPFWFDPEVVLANEIKTGQSLTDIGWPSAISADFVYMATTSKTMSVLYVLGVGASGLSILLRVWTSATGRDPQLSNEFTCLFISLLNTGSASTIASVMATEFVKLINHHAQGSGVSADPGRKFLQMTWAAVILLFIASSSILTAVIIDRSKRCHCDPPEGEAKPLLEE